MPPQVLQHYGYSLPASAGHYSCSSPSNGPSDGWRGAPVPVCLSLRLALAFTSFITHIPSPKWAHRRFHDGHNVASLWICVFHRCDWRACHFWYSFFSYIRPHLIFVRTGAFVAGIIVPREGGLAIALTEKLEDMVAILFLPLVRSFHHPPFLVNVAPVNSTSRSPAFPPIWGY